MVVSEDEFQKQKKYGSQTETRGTNQSRNGWMNSRKNQNNDPIVNGVASFVVGFVGPSNLFWHGGITTEKFNKGILSC